ncbi:MAG TPA: RsmE family RNA methyltransferase [Alphaproteobacteria bacterium]
MRHIPRFYCPDLILAADQTVRLPDHAAHHARNVLRLRDGGEIKLFNARDGEWTGSASFPDRRNIDVTLQEKIAATETLPDVTLVLAPLKNKDSFDNAIRHAVELGVTQIQLVLTERTQQAKLNEDRLQQQIIDAVQQCGRLTVPQLSLPVKLETLLKNWPADKALLPCVEGDTTRAKPLKNVLAQVKAPLAILIGPEGGFSPAEKNALTVPDSRFHPVSLGDLILRSDTAVAAALAIML